MSDTAVLPVKPFALGSGTHPNVKAGACFNELAAVLAGEPFADSPACVSPIVRRLGMRLNDRLDDEYRQLLRPLVLRSLGTATDGREEERRRMCNEWLLHETLPDLLDAADRKEMADKLRALPADLAVEGVRRAIREARDEARAARRSAIDRLKDRVLAELRKRPDVDAALVAAVDAAVDAAADVVAAVVAVAPYWAVRDAAYNAVYRKVREVLKPRREERLRSAIGLLDRMLSAEPLLAPVIPIEDARVICAAPEIAA